MKRNKIIYRTATALIVMVMLFSIYMMYTPDYFRLGFPIYFRTELVIAKALGLLVLLIPGMPVRLREWAYAGFGIVLISASVAHYNSGDALMRSLEPMIFLALLVVSYLYGRRIVAASHTTGTL